MRPLRQLNQVLLAKLCWRCLSKPRTLWASMLIIKYGRREGHQFLGSSHTSTVWTGLQWGYKLLTQGLAEPPPASSHRLWWQPSLSGKFSAASTHDLIQNAPVDTLEATRWNAIWRLKGPSRGAMLLWLIGHDRSKTKNFL